MDNDLRAERLDERRFAEWHGQLRAKRTDLAARGGDRAAAEARVDQELDRLFPEGFDTRDQHVFLALHDDSEIGLGWLAIHDRSEGFEADLRDLKVFEAARRDQVIETCERYAGDFGAACLRLNVPVGAIETFQRLGYGVTMFVMKRPDYLDTEISFPGIDEPLRLEQMTDDQLVQFRVAVGQDHAFMRAQAGNLPWQESAGSAYAPFKRLTDGVRTPGHHLLVGYEGDQPVVRMWIEVEERESGPHGYANYVHVDEAHRGKAYAKRMSLAVNRYLRNLGVVEMRGATYGPNLPARRLAEAVGYVVTDVQMRKDL